MIDAMVTLHAAIDTHYNKEFIFLSSKQHFNKLYMMIRYTDVIHGVSFPFEEECQTRCLLQRYDRTELDVLVGGWDLQFLLVPTSSPYN